MDVDPIELELTRNLFEAAAEEMGITRQRVAFSANIKPSGRRTSGWGTWRRNSRRTASGPVAWGG